MTTKGLIADREVDKTIYWKQFEDSRERFVNPSIRLVRNALNNQAIGVLREISQTQVVNPQFVESVSEEDMERSVKTIYSNVGVSFAKRVRSEVSPKKDEIDLFFNNAMEAFVAGNVIDRILGITDHSRELLTRIINQALEEGLSIPNTVKLIRDTWKEFSRFRAERIARTEIISASNYGSIIGAESTGLNLKKIWLSTRDNRVRDSHALADAQKREMKDNFLVGASQLRFPGDPAGAPEEVINCRCTVIYEVV